MPIKILLAEDHTDTREMLAALLDSEGYTVISAEDGMVGLNKAEHEHPDLVLTDINMPNLDGIGMIKRLRRQAAFSQIPIVALTAYGADVQSQAIKSGADRAMSKPVDYPYLLNVIEHLV